MCCYHKKVATQPNASQEADAYLHRILSDTQELVATLPYVSLPYKGERASILGTLSGWPDFVHLI